MKRSFLMTSFISLLLAGCTKKAVHEADIPFTYTILNGAVLSDGKYTLSTAVPPNFEVNDIAFIADDGSPYRITEIYDNLSFQHIVLRVPADRLSKSPSNPNIFNVYRSGDTLFLSTVEGLPYSRPVPNRFPDFKCAKAIDPIDGEVVSRRVNNTDSIGGSINGYTILQLSSYNETLEVELPDEIELVSSDPKNPDLMQVYQLYPGKIKLGFYDPKIHSKQ